MTDWWKSDLEAYKKISISNSAPEKKKAGKFVYARKDGTSNELTWTQVTSNLNKIDFNNTKIENSEESFYKMVLAYQSSEMPYAGVFGLKIEGDNLVATIDDFVTDLHNYAKVIQNRNNEIS